ncbi:MAG: DEAD/DEAH box helicase [Chitinophagales bacterium]
MNFEELNLNTPLLNALNDLGYTRATTIQERAFSVVMSGRDVVGIAQTGTGKTFAYLLPCLRLWKFQKDKVPQILILVPTRELVVQVREELQKLSKYINVTSAGVYGGTNINTQIAEVMNGVEIIVATPGRLIDLSLKGALKLKTIRKLVIDEVDEMLNLGFRSQLKLILDLLPLKRQNIMFSATMTDDVEALIHDFFNNPVKIEAAPTGTPLANIIQSCYEVPNFNTKVNLLRLLLKDESMSKVLVFAATKKLADQVYEQLEPDWMDKIGVIHSNKSQNHRFEAVRQFHEGIHRVLIATDVVARGIDISEVTHVINFDLPEVPENYMHRIGRTGRADKKGVAISFITSREAEARAAIETLMNQAIPVVSLPDDLFISTQLTRDEMPKVYQPNMDIKAPIRLPSGPAFHEKKEKNLKVSGKGLTRAEKMRVKYGKPKTRGQKKKGK